MKRSILRILLAILTICIAIEATAQINYSGGTYSESFNTLFKDDGTGIVMAGVGAIGAQDAIPTLTTWRAARVGGTGTGTFALFADWGGSGTGRLYSYGTTVLSPIAYERALGSVASGTTMVGFGTYFINTSPDTYQSITISFDREVWRNQSLAADQSLSFAFGFSSAGISDTDFLTHSGMTLFAALNATSPAALGGVTSAGRDGNAEPYKASVSGTISGIHWAPNQTLFIRWNDFDDGGTDAGIGIDNLKMIATVPEPSCGLLLGLGCAAMAVLRRNTR